MKPACPRQFEAEAWREGRLSGAEIARFQAHLRVCSRCTREVQSLKALADALRAPVADTDELHVRRERTRLLAAFNARVVPAPVPARAKLWLGAATVLLACAALALASRHSRGGDAVPVVSALSPAVEPIQIHADSSAKWSRQAENRIETIRLESGSLSIRVDHAASPRRLVVILPDGKLEDIGTTFSVSTDAGQTTRVSVQEGSVVLCLDGKPPLALGAGEAWSPSTAPVPSSSAALPRPVAHSRQLSASAVQPFAGATPSALDDASLIAPDAAAEFRLAMAALDRGDNTRAAFLFNRFVTAHPSDRRTEDASYLGILALQRAGDPAAMQLAARDYLRRYPHGFRKAEVEALER